VRSADLGSGPGPKSDSLLSIFLHRERGPHPAVADPVNILKFSPLAIRPTAGNGTQQPS
jgi:hypothetical protein